MKTEKLLETQTTISKKNTVKELNKLMKKLPNYKKEKPKKNFLWLEIRKDQSSILYKSFTSAVYFS